MYTGAKQISPLWAMAQANRVTCNEGPSPLHSGPRNKDDERDVVGRGLAG